MNGKEILGLRIKQLRAELKHALSEYKRMSTGEDAWGDPESLSDAERASLVTRDKRAAEHEAFRKLGDPGTMNKILAKIAE